MELMRLWQRAIAKSSSALYACTKVVRCYVPETRVIFHTNQRSISRLETEPCTIASRRAKVEEKETALVDRFTCQ